MANKEQLNPAAASLQEKEALTRPKLSPNEIQDRLDKYDGFEELLMPLADHLDRFAAKAESKKRRFLQDGNMREERKELLDRLRAYVDVFSRKEVAGHKQVRAIAQEKLDSNEALINENLSAILREARELERTYRQLELFFRNAAPQKVKNLTLISVHPEVLVDPDSNLLYKMVEKRITDQSRAVDQKKAYSILAIPELWRSTQPKNIIERYAKLAAEARISFLTDFADCDSVEECIKERESKKWQGIVGPELHHSKLILFANHLVLRGAYPGLDEEDELRGSPAMAVAGKMYSEKISQPIMGEMNGSISSANGIAFHTVVDEIGDLSEVGLNGLMHAYEKDMVYECCTAFDGAEYALKRYAVVRTFDYVNRVLRHYLGKVTGQQLDQARANNVRFIINDFLKQLAEQKIITKGKVTYFDWNKRVPDRIDVNIEIIPLYAVRTFVYALKAKNREASSELIDPKD
jgi:hypothetical protein